MNVLKTFKYHILDLDLDLDCEISLLGRVSVYNLEANEITHYNKCFVPITRLENSIIVVYNKRDIEMLKQFIDYEIVHE